MFLMLTRAEVESAIDVLRGASFNSDGYAAIRFPILAVQTKKSSEFSFCDSSCTVTCRNKTATLSSVPYRLFKLVAERGDVQVEDAQDLVWGKEVSDSAIKMACSRVSNALFEGGINCNLSVRCGKISMLLQE